MKFQDVMSETSEAAATLVVASPNVGIDNPCLAVPYSRFHKQQLQYPVSSAPPEAQFPTNCNSTLAEEM